MTTRTAMTTRGEAAVPTKGPKIPKHRSPNYPAIGLSEAIDLVGKFFKAANRATVDPATAVQAMGYQVLTGATRAYLSALRKYGLLDNLPNGVRVSELAVRILHNPEGSEDRQAAINEAALKPDIFREIARMHAETSDEVLKGQLLMRKPPFSPSGADQFIRAFRDTMSLAKLNGSQYDWGMGTGAQTPPSTSSPLTAAHALGRQQHVQSPPLSWLLPGGVFAEIRFIGGPITREHFEVLEDYLAIAKKAAPEAKSAERE
jgi:hypothetical protein